MQYQDTIYGVAEIDEDWAIDIVGHPSFLRLKGINQYGYIKPFHPEALTTRYEHSVGVYLLLKRYGLGEKERFAGLLHDISHTAFSHCIDYALPGKNAEKQAHQDDTHEEYLVGNPIAKVINKHSFSIADATAYAKYQALELELPDLCADRIDYVLRDAASFGIFSKEKVAFILSKLTWGEGRWYFNDFAAARDFSFLFKKMNNDFYATPWTGVMFSTVGQYLRHALEKKYIRMADLYLTDNEVIGKINFFLKSDSVLQENWRLMNHSEYKLDQEDFDFQIKVKSRVVDPWLFHQGELIRFSAAYKDWVAVVEREMRPKVYNIKYK